MKQIKRYKAERFHVVNVDRGLWSEIYVNGFIAGADNLTGDQVAVLDGLLDDRSAAHIRLFGGDSGLPEDLLCKLNCDNVAIDRFEQQVTGMEPFVGLGAFILRANESTGFESMRFDGKGVGWMVEAGEIRMGYLSGVRSPFPSEKEAFRDTYEQTILKIFKMGFEATDLIRTWCYFRDILAEYDAFNEIRKELLQQYGLLDGLLPASTGIQGAIDSGEQLTMDALAFAGPGIKLKRVLNESQREASDYGSYFSRGIKVQGLGPEQLIVSGMASIGETGETLFAEDPVAQVESTIEKAKRLLKDNDFDWADCVSGIIYIKPEHFNAISEKLPDTPLADLPFCRSFVDICRPDLSFEIEFMAFKS